MAYIDDKGRLIYNAITSPEVVQLNYLASWSDKHRVDDFINVYTGVMPWNWGTPPISHTEIGFWLDGELWSFSSTSRSELGKTDAKKNGTRWIRGFDLLENPHRWLIQEKVVHRVEIHHSINRANDIIDLTYDFAGVAADFVNPVRVFKQYEFVEAIGVLEIKKIYCSKAVHLVDTGKLAVFSPKRRYKWASKHGYKTVTDNTYVWMGKKGICNV